MNNSNKKVGKHSFFRSVSMKDQHDKDSCKINVYIVVSVLASVHPAVSPTAAMLQAKKPLCFTVPNTGALALRLRSSQFTEP